MAAARGAQLAGGIGVLMTVDRVSEAVLDRHLGDLAQATEIALLRAGRHGTSLARRPPDAWLVPYEMRLIVARQAPFGALTSTVSPTLRPSSADPSGEVGETEPVPPTALTSTLIV